MWKSIDTYPRCDCDGGWGAEALLRNGDQEAKGWQEAGYWLMVDENDARCCDDLPFVPTQWLDDGQAWTCPALAE
jgi:hypothetical protein